jgi:hypothetical protein
MGRFYERTPTEPNPGMLPKPPAPADGLPNASSQAWPSWRSSISSLPAVLDGTCGNLIQIARA